MALVKTRQTLGKLENIRKEIGLAPDLFPEVAVAFENALSAIAQERDYAKARELRKKQKEWMAGNPAYAESSHGHAMPFAGLAGGGYMPPASAMPDFDDED